MNNHSIQPSIGEITGVIQYRDGRSESIRFTNTILQAGREALASCLANNIGDAFEFYISNMVFGDGGATEGRPKIIGSGRTGLFGTTVATKPVIITIPNDLRAQIIIVSVLQFDEANTTINEMGLRMANNELYSMATWGGFTKNDNMQITWSWAITMI